MFSLIPFMLFSSIYYNSPSDEVFLYLPFFIYFNCLLTSPSPPHIWTSTFPHTFLISGHHSVLYIPLHSPLTFPHIWTFLLPHTFLLSEPPLDLYLSYIWTTLGPLLPPSLLTSFLTALSLPTPTPFSLFL